MLQLSHQELTVRIRVIVRNYIHFGPWSLWSLVTSAFFKRSEVTKDRIDQGRSALTTSALGTDLSICDRS